MALEFQRGDTAPFNAPLLAPLVSHGFGLRLRLVAKRILQYQHMYALPPALRAVAEKLLAE